MARDDISDLLDFVAVAREGSFTRAAALRGLSQSSLSHRISDFERRLGLPAPQSHHPQRGADRSRRPSPGRGCPLPGRNRCGARFPRRAAGPSGWHDPLTASSHAAEAVLWPIWADFLGRYPEVRLELTIDQGFTDIVRDRYDVGIRLGEAVDRDMIALRVGPDLRMAAVAAPSYFAAHGRPGHPRDLIGHNCINLRFQSQGSLYAWEFEKDGHSLNVRVDGQMTVNLAAHALRAALDGVGLAFVPEDMATRDLAAGRLERVLGDWCPHFGGFHFYYPSRRQHSRAFALLLGRAAAVEVPAAS